MIASPLVEQVFASLRAQFQQLVDMARAEAQRRYFNVPMGAQGLPAPTTRGRV